jgi:general secretion pathway protein D
MSNSGTSSPSSDIAQHVREVDLGARQPRRPLQPTTSADQRGLDALAVSYYGEGDTKVAGGRPPKNPGTARSDGDPVTTGAVPTGADAGDKGYEINFENTPVAQVTKAILGDILGIGYITDPRIQGTVSLSTGRPVPKKDLLYIYESALRASNIALVREGRGYRLLPAVEAVGSGPIDVGEGPDAGYGISVVPLQFVAASTLMKLLDNFAAKPGMVRAEPSRNLIIVQGNGADRRAAIDTVLSFDADWMRGQSVGIYPVRNSALVPIIAELEHIIDSGEGGLSQNVVKLQPIGRQNAVLVVTRDAGMLKTVATWITRLDKTGNAGTGVKVYRMRYGDARQTAAFFPAQRHPRLELC